jgi:hypothetical protein
MMNRVRGVNTVPISVGVKETPSCGMNDRINLAIVYGLLIIDGLMWAGTFGLLYMGKQVPDTIVLAAVGIGTGFLGYLTREYTSGNGATSVSAGKVDTVNVEQPYTEPDPSEGSEEVPDGPSAGS